MSAGEKIEQWADSRGKQKKEKKERDEQRAGSTSSMHAKKKKPTFICSHARAKHICGADYDYVGFKIHQAAQNVAWSSNL